MEHRCFFRVADISIQIEMDVPITERTFVPRVNAFRVDGPGEDIIRIHHLFGLPQLDRGALGQKIFEANGSGLYRKADRWTYLGRGYVDDESRYWSQVAIVNPSHTKMDIYNERRDVFLRGNLGLLSFYPSDLLFLTKVLADRQGAMFHSSGVVMDARGLLFVGHSGAGKSTIVKMLSHCAEILCDERIVVRKGEEGHSIYGTWHHGEIPIVSPESAPLKAIMFLNKAEESRVEAVTDRVHAISRLIACTFKPATSGDWWAKTLSFITSLVREVPCYCLSFNRSGDIVDLFDNL